MPKPTIKQLKAIKPNTKIKKIQIPDDIYINIIVLENDLDHKQLEVDLIGQNNVVINYENIIDIELYE